MVWSDKERNEIVIEDSDLITVTEMNHIVEVQFLKKMNSCPTIRKINSKEYVYLVTGEVKAFQLNGIDRTSNSNELRRTFKRLRYLINNNFVGNKNELFCTLTYAENMTDNNRLYLDFKKFIQRFKYRFKNLGKIEYLNVVEPQDRGAWHCHLLLKFVEQEKVFIPNSELSDIWGHGFVRVVRLDDVDNIGAYLTSYLADMPIEEGEPVDSVGNVVEKKIDGKTKRFIKGGRLHLYPKGMNLFRKTKGIVYPERKKMKYKDVKEKLKNYEMTFSKNVFLDTEDYNNEIRYESYNLKRKNSREWKC